MFFFKVNRSSYAVMLLAIVLLNLVLISHFMSPAEASKKKMIKKLKKMLPLLLALKSKKKIFLLPIPLPMP